MVIECDDSLLQDCTSVGTTRFVPDVYRKDDQGKFVYVFRRNYKDCIMIFCDIIMDKQLEDCENYPRVQEVGKCLSKDLHQMFESKQFTDFKIKCDDRVFDCPRILLAARSIVFRAMLETSTDGEGYLESKTGVVVVEDISPEVMEQLIKYVYTDEVDDKVLEVMADKLLQAGHKYEMHGLKDICSRFLAKSIDKENVFELVSMAKLYNLPFLQAKAIKFIKSSDDI